MTAATIAPTHGTLAKIRPDVTYYEHQIDGVRRLCRMGSALLADDMGLGKSIQALTVAAVDFEMGKADRVLIIAPASLKWNWLQEVEDHTLFTATVLEGTPAQRMKQLNEFDTDILIVGYEQVVAHVDDLNALGFQVVIYDESHYIKSHSSKRSKACHKLRGNRHLLLTGSPLLNHANDLWSPLNRIAPGEFPKYWAFVHRYCNPPEAPIWMADLSFAPLGNIRVGNEIVGWKRLDGRRSYQVATVEAIGRRVAPLIKITLESGRVVRCTPDHQWLSAAHGGLLNNGNPRVDTDLWVSFGPGRVGRPGTAMSHVIEPTQPLSVDLQRKADWLAGMYDGEGSTNQIAQSASANPEICERIRSVLTELAIPFSETDDHFNMLGGRQTLVNLANWWRGTYVKDDYFARRVFAGNRTSLSAIGQMNRTKDRVVSVEPDGEGEVVSMQTSTGNYVAWGYASKNCLFGGYKDKEIIGIKNEGELREKLECRMVRRLKADTLDLPEKQHIQVWVELSPLQRKLYDQAVTEMMIDLPDDPNPMEFDNALTKFLRLKMICGTSATIPGYEDHSMKLDRATEMALDIIEQGEHVVLFTQFREVLACMARRLGVGGADPYVLHGDVPASERVGVVQKWARTEPAPLLGMLQVAGTGLNMTAASKCIFVDKLFVPKLNEQAEDRLHRIGTGTQPIQIFEMLTRKTIEQRVEVILKRKRKVFNTLVENPSAWQRKLYASLKDDVE